MCLECVDLQWQYVLVDDTPVRVESGVSLEMVLEKLDLPTASAGIYTDGDGKQKVLPPEAIVADHVPRNAEITVERRVTVEQRTENDLFSQTQQSATEDAEGKDGLATSTVYVEGDPITVDGQTTAKQLKDLAGASDGEYLTFEDGSGGFFIKDDQCVLDCVDPGTRLYFSEETICPLSPL